MFSFVIKRRGPYVNIFERYVITRQINNNCLSRSVLRRDETSINNLEKQCWVKHVRINYINDRKYSIIPEPIEKRGTHMMFVTHEDSFAHSILESKEIYSGNLAKDLPHYQDEVTEGEIDNYLSKSWKALPVSEIIEAFKRISFYASKNNESIVDEKYEKFIRYLITNCNQFSDSEICNILVSISLWPILHTRQDPIFQSLCLALDRECVFRAPRWTINKSLLVADYWWKLRLLKYTDFINYLMKRIGNKPKKMTASNLVQFMFYINSTRRHPSEMYNLEHRMESCIDELDINELSILAMGFFKSQSPIRNSNLLKNIIRRVINDIDTIHEIALSALFKICRYSFTLQNECALFWELIVSAVPQISRLSIPALVHIVLSAVKVKIFHPELLTSIAQRLNDEIKNARMKDMERIVLALSSFNFTPQLPSNIFQTVVEEIRTANRRPELMRYQRSLASLLQYLGVVNIYPKDLTALVLDPVNLKTIYGVSPYGLTNGILIVDLNVDVEVPDYVGPRLNNQQRSIIAKAFVNKIPKSTEQKLSARHSFLLEIMDTCKDIFGSTEMLHLDWVLPQYKEADIILCLDENNSALPVAQSLSKIPFGDVKRRPDIYPEGCRWIALVIGGVNCYVRNSVQLLGKDSMKVRQLEKIGYKPIVIAAHDWSTISQDRKSYLEKLILK